MKAICRHRLPVNRPSRFLRVCLHPSPGGATTYFHSKAERRLAGASGRPPSLSTPSTATTSRASGAMATTTTTMLGWFSEKLHSYISSGEDFRLIAAATRSNVQLADEDECEDGDRQRQQRRLPRRIVILDSSFNPPTLAHLSLAASAVRSVGQRGTRLVLLLAVNNADKAPKPASFEARLVMMNAFANDLQQMLDDSYVTDDCSCPEEENDDDDDRMVIDDEEPDIPCGIDIALTTKPYFHQKSAALAAAAEAAAESSRTSNGGGADTVAPPPQELIFLVGYDTLIRIFDPRYYPSSNGTAQSSSSSQLAASSPSSTTNTTETKTTTPMQAALDPFFRRSRLRVTLRDGPESGWGTLAEQQAYMAAVRQGDVLVAAGGRAEWGERVEGSSISITGTDDGSGGGSGRGETARTAYNDAISSTAAREAARDEDWDRLRALVPVGVMREIQKMRLYLAEEEEGSP